MQPGKELAICLKCQRPFMSVDRKYNRICADCAYDNAQLSRLERTRGASLCGDCNLTTPTDTALPIRNDV